MMTGGEPDVTDEGGVEQKPAGLGVALTSQKLTVPSACSAVKLGQ